MAMKLLFHDRTYHVQQTLLAARYAGVELEEVTDFKGKEPILQTPQGELNEPNTISQFVARLNPLSTVYGRSIFESAQVDQWIQWAMKQLEPARNAWLLPVQNKIVFDQGVYTNAKRDIRTALSVLDKHLMKSYFLVGNTVTLADIVVATMLAELYSTVIDPRLAGVFKSTLRWFTTVVHQPHLEAVLGKFEFAKNEKRAPKPKKAPKKQQQKKQQKKEEKKAPAKKKVVNPLTLLPPSKMHLDTVKKLFFSKQPFNEKFFDEFWTLFDAEGYSIYRNDYKYNDDNKIFWMTQNGIGGYLQRLDPLRKFGFGCLVLKSKDEDTPPFKQCGAWIFRGQDVPAEMMNVDESEYYAWTKMDPKKPEDRETFKTFMQGDDFEGDKVLDRRYFK